jgi:SAM-dependent methyltransferase
MGIDVMRYREEVYPAFQAEGNAAQFAIPFARKVCKGIGYDIGCNRLEWKFDDAIPIDLTFGTDALDLPDTKMDYIFSSHCLEHLTSWVDALDHWGSRLKRDGVLFLYLPHYSQKYWRPWNNRKHNHAFTQDVIRDYLNDSYYKNVFVSGVDLNNAFIAMGQKTV